MNVGIRRVERFLGLLPQLNDNQWEMVYRTLPSDADCEDAGAIIFKHRELAGRQASRDLADAASWAHGQIDGMSLTLTLAMPTVASLDPDGPKRVLHAAKEVVNALLVATQGDVDIGGNRSSPRLVARILYAPFEVAMPLDGLL